MRRLVLLAARARLWLRRSWSTARSAWGTASRRPRCWWRPARPGRRVGGHPLLRDRHLAGLGLSHHTLGNTDWRTVGDPGAARLRRCLRRRDPPGQASTPTSPCPVVAAHPDRRSAPTSPGGSSPAAAPLRPRPAPASSRRSGLFAGALDAVGGGGWGPVGTSSLLASGRLEPRKVVGSVDTAEFVVAVGGSLGFLVGLGSRGHRVGLRRRADGRRHGRRADRRHPRALPAGPGARRRRRRPDRAHQPPDPGRVVRRVRA